MKTALSNKPSFFKPWQLLVIGKIFMSKESMTNREVYEYINPPGEEEEIGRASITVFLSNLFDEGFLSFTEETGKGGTRRAYKPLYSLEEFWDMIVLGVSNQLSEERNQSLKGSVKNE